ncbi:hypothetical protein D3C75_564170 [compost metagenome]
MLIDSGNWGRQNKGRPGVIGRRMSITFVDPGLDEQGSLAVVIQFDADFFLIGGVDHPGAVDHNGCLGLRNKQTASQDQPRKQVLREGKRFHGVSPGWRVLRTGLRIVEAIRWHVD